MDKYIITISSNLNLDVEEIGYAIADVIEYQLDNSRAAAHLSSPAAAEWHIEIERVMEVEPVYDEV